MQTKDNAHFHIVLVKAWVEKDGKFLMAQRGSQELHINIIRIFFKKSRYGDLFL